MFVTKDDFNEMWSGDPLDETAWQRVEGLLRRAERELTALVGDLPAIDDHDLVKDTLVDAVIESQLVDNPGHFRSESDGGYSYTRYTLPSGRSSRFWWPNNLLELFGKNVDPGHLRIRRIVPSPMGWIQ